MGIIWVILPRAMYALLELHIWPSILWLLDMVLHHYPGKHEAVHECYTVAWLFEKQFEKLLHFQYISAFFGATKKQFYTSSFSFFLVHF